MSEIPIAKADSYTNSTEMEEVSNLIQTRLQNSDPYSPTPGKCSIHRVPTKFHKMTEPSKYKPERISIGPFHRGDQSFKAMEDVKLFYARRLLARKDEKYIIKEAATTSSTPGTLVKRGWITALDECILSIRKIEPEIRECYSESIDLNSRQFVEMMVIDGLFIIEMLIRSRMGDTINNDDTPLYRNLWLLVGIKSDLLLLENQLPFVVLKRLFAHIALPHELDGTSLGMMVNHFLIYHLKMLPAKNNTLDRHLRLERCEDAKHLLDLLSILLQPSPEDDKHMVFAKSPSSTSSMMKWKDYIIAKIMNVLHEKFNKGVFTDPKDEIQLIPSATDLKRAGVKFKKGSEKANFMDFKFTSDGIFEISPLKFFDETDMMLRNIIACEQLYSGRGDMSCYAQLMDCLINSVRDVEILRKEGIIKNYVGCDEDVSNTFNKLSVHVSVDNSRYYNTTQEVNKFYNQSWHTWKAMLKREYFHNPWAIVSVFAAGLLINLTIISTVCGILQVVL